MDLKSMKKLSFGKSEILKIGTNITIIAFGKTVAKAAKIADICKRENISVEVINLRFLKPLDKETILNSIKKTKNVITIEDGFLTNGMGDTIVNLINEQNIEGVKIKKFGYPDEFIKHGNIDEIEKKYGLDIDSIKQYIKACK